jgi:hypothetical protein
MKFIKPGRRTEVTALEAKLIAALIADRLDKHRARGLVRPCNQPTKSARLHQG